MITLIEPAQYRRTPWKNGGGVTVDIAEDGDVWRFGRTPITTPGPFSDYAGFDRLQVLVAGRGLVLDTPDGEIDLRTPFRPVRFRGETPITSRLEAGSVEVVNLIGARAKVRLALDVLTTGSVVEAERGTLLIYAAAGSASVEIGGSPQEVARDHTLRVDSSGSTTIAGKAGMFLLGRVTCV